MDSQAKLAIFLAMCSLVIATTATGLRRRSEIDISKDATLNLPGYFNPLNTNQEWWRCLGHATYVTQRIVSTEGVRSEAPFPKDDVVGLFYAQSAVKAFTSAHPELLSPRTIAMQRWQGANGGVHGFIEVEGYARVPNDAEMVSVTKETFELLDDGATGPRIAVAPAPTTKRIFFVVTAFHRADALDRFVQSIRDLQMTASEFGLCLTHATDDSASNLEPVYALQRETSADIMVLSRPRPFHKAALLEECLSFVADDDIAFMIDVDVTPSRKIIDNIRRYVVEGERIYSPVVWYQETDETKGPIGFARGGTGVIAAFKSDVRRAGGYAVDVFQEKYGYEDTDFFFRLKSLKLEIVRFGEQELVHWAHSRTWVESRADMDDLCPGFNGVAGQLWSTSELKELKARAVASPTGTSGSTMVNPTTEWSFSQTTNLGFSQTTSIEFSQTTSIGSTPTTTMPASQTTSMPTVETTGVQTTEVQTTAVQTTDVQTTGVQTTDVQTTGVQTTGVQIVYNSTTGVAIASLRKVEITMVLYVNISTFNLTAFTDRMANFLGIPVDQLQITLQASKRDGQAVNVLMTIFSSTNSSSPSVDSLAQKVQAAAANPALSSAAFGVVAVVSSVTIVPAASPVSSPTPTTPTPSGSKGLSRGGIAGIVIGSVAFVAIVAAVAVFLVRRNRQPRSIDDSSPVESTHLQPKSYEDDGVQLPKSNSSAYKQVRTGKETP